MAEINKKRSTTMFEKYGVDWYTESEDCKEKIKQTCLEKYGVEYSCLRKECRQHSNDSKPNKYFEQLLIDNNISYEREFVLDRKAFDFKIDNILIEINPSITHNSTFQIFNKKPLDSKYHYEKSQIALKNNYRCIHVYDWDDLNKIINLLKPRKTIGARKCKCKEIDLASANMFINNYHLQGAIKANRAFGLFL